MTDAVYLSFMPERHAFGISEDEIEKIIAAGLDFGIESRQIA